MKLSQPVDPTILKKPFFMCGLTSGRYRRLRLHTFPLSQRGWCFREHILSKRILQYKEMSIYWSAGTTGTTVHSGRAVQGTVDSGDMRVIETESYAAN
jgi:hypothetical protein